jgi:hypothetical protein
MRGVCVDTRRSNNMNSNAVNDYDASAADDDDDECMFSNEEK